MLQCSLRRLYLWTVGVPLGVTGVAKVVMVLGSAAILDTSDPLVGLPFWYLLLVSGVAEMCVTVLCFSAKRAEIPLMLTAWVGTGFVLYRWGLWFIGWHHPCACMGSLVGALHLSDQAADNIMKGVLVPSSGQLRDSPLGVAAEETGQGAAWRRCRLRLVGGGMAPGAKVSAVGRAVITAVLGAGGQRAEDRGRRTEGGGQRTEDRGRTTDNGPRTTDRRALITDHWPLITGRKPSAARGRWFCWWGFGSMGGCSSWRRRRRFGYCWRWGEMISRERAQRAQKGTAEYAEYAEGEGGRSLLSAYSAYFAVLPLGAGVK